MKKTFLLLTAWLPMLALAQMTPRAAMEKCGILSPEKYAYLTKVEETSGFEYEEASDYDKFVESHKALEEQVAQWMTQLLTKSIESITIPTVQAIPKNVPTMVDPQQMMANMQRYMKDLKTHYKLTDKEFDKLQEMNDKQMEAFITKRCKELGVKPLDPADYGMSYNEESQAEQQQGEINREKIMAAEKDLEEYQTRSTLVIERIDQLQIRGMEQVDSIAELRAPQLNKLNSAVPGAEDVAMGLVPVSEYNERYMASLKEQVAVKKEKYDIWQKSFIVPARASLIELMDYAEKADEAQKTIASIGMSETLDPVIRQAYQSQASSGYAHVVWELFLRVTENISSEEK